jgi:hypothetical protein
MGELAHYRKHMHYCIEGDHRWTCEANPCLRYGASPCALHTPANPPPGLVMPVAVAQHLRTS